jgi:nitrite reductase/ring-hydroxylating ferredoxin subunit/Fe-S cluster biogenesis protein NfuA
MTSTATQVAPTDELQRLAEQVDRTYQATRALDEPARKQADELRQAIEAFHKAGLIRMVRRLKDDPVGKTLLFELVDDPLIHALFVMHGIVKADPTTRVQQVLDQVRPYMQSHGGDVELVEVALPTVYVRLKGACNGCSMSAVTLREGVEEAILGQIPEVKRIEVLPNEPSPAIITLDQIGVVRPEREHGWVRGPAVQQLPAGRMRRLDVGDLSILLVNVGNRISAFRNACAHQGLPLDSGLLDPETGELTCPWHGFCFDTTSGECLTAPQAQLESFPLRIEDGVIWVRPTA